LNKLEGGRGVLLLGGNRLKRNRKNTMSIKKMGGEGLKGGGGREKNFQNFKGKERRCDRHLRLNPGSKGKRCAGLRGAGKRGPEGKDKATGDHRSTENRRPSNKYLYPNVMASGRPQ